MSEVDLHAYSVGARRVEDEFLSTGVDSGLRGMCLVGHVVHVELDAGVTCLVCVTNTEVHVEVATDLVEQPELLRSICGGYIVAIHCGDISGAILARPTVEGGEELACLVST